MFPGFRCAPFLFLFFHLRALFSVVFPFLFPKKRRRERSNKGTASFVVFFVAPFFFLQSDQTRNATTKTNPECLFFSPLFFCFLRFLSSSYFLFFQFVAIKKRLPSFPQKKHSHPQLITHPIAHPIAQQAAQEHVVALVRCSVHPHLIGPPERPPDRPLESFSLSSTFRSLFICFLPCLFLSLQNAPRSKFQ